MSWRRPGDVLRGQRCPGKKTPLTRTSRRFVSRMLYETISLRSRAEVDALSFRRATLQAFKVAGESAARTERSRNAFPAAQTARNFRRSNSYDDHMFRWQPTHSKFLRHNLFDLYARRKFHLESVSKAYLQENGRSLGDNCYPPVII